MPPSHPDFYSVLSFCRDEERFAYVRLVKYDKCKPNVKRAKRDIVKDLNLADYSTMLISGGMNIIKNFLKISRNRV